MEILKKSFLSFTSKETLDTFFELGKLVHLKKNEIYSAAGEVANYFYIIKSGYARSYYEDENGKQFIRTIFAPNKTTGAVDSLVTRKPSKLSYDCLTDCEMYKFDYIKFKEITKKNLAMSQFYSAVLEFIFAEIGERFFDLSVLNATQRYIKLKNEIPNIENVIPQYHIASYLNVTPVQLSRIRKDLYSN